MKIIINRCFGGFGVSQTALDFYYGETGRDYDDDPTNKNCRTDPIMIRIIENIGEYSFGDFAKLQIVEISDDIDWVISDYDGMETIHERHQSWP